MTLDEHIENEAQRLFAALGQRHGRDIDFYRLMMRRCIAPTPEEMQFAMDAIRRIGEFLGPEPFHICYAGVEGLEDLSLPPCRKSKRRERRPSRIKVQAPLRESKPH